VKILDYLNYFPVIAGDVYSLENLRDYRYDRFYNRYTGKTKTFKKNKRRAEK
jgi:hypothetical protein